MKVLKLIAVIGLLSFASGAATAGSCVKAGGEATMVTEDLAKFMASAALKNQMSAEGYKPSGKVMMKCEAATLGTHCVAHQRACK